MKRLVLLVLLFGLGSPANAFWGSTEEEKNICRNRAKGERNEFSAKQTYKYCLKNLKEERESKAKEEKLQIQKAKKLKKSCERKVKDFRLDKKLQIEKKSWEEWISFSQEKSKPYRDWLESNKGVFYFGFERYLLEEYGQEKQELNDDYLAYIKDGCEELSVDGYKPDVEYYKNYLKRIGY